MTGMDNVVVATRNCAWSEPAEPNTGWAGVRDAPRQSTCANLSRRIVSGCNTSMPIIQYMQQMARIDNKASPLTGMFGRLKPNNGYLAFNGCDRLHRVRLLHPVRMIQPYQRASGILSEGQVPENTAWILSAALNLFEQCLKG